jgi:histidinol-phosphate aminotransferase
LVSEELMGLGVKVYPSATNFLLVDFGVRAPRILHQLEKRRILLRDRISDFGRTGFVRVTIGMRPQMRRLIRSLEQLW